MQVVILIGFYFTFNSLWMLTREARHWSWQAKECFFLLWRTFTSKCNKPGQTRCKKWKKRRQEHVDSIMWLFSNILPYLNQFYFTLVVWGFWRVRKHELYMNCGFLGAWWLSCKALKLHVIEKTTYIGVSGNITYIFLCCI